MLKQLGKHDFLLSPFVATKEWELYNVDNNDLVLLEPLTASNSLSDTYVSLDYVDYYDVPMLNRDCNISLEQQDTDQVIFEEGLNESGLFDPNSEEQNPNGTYKRLVYSQIDRAFYNTYHNPLQIFGMETIDFPKSRTQRYIANEFVVFTIPQRIFGDRILEGSVQLYDVEFNDNITILDDSNGNLVVGSNLFSKVQEVRRMGNEIMSGSSGYLCPSYP